MRKGILSIISLVLVFAMCFTLSACGGSGSGDTNTDSDEVYELKIAHVVAETDDVHLGFVQLKDMLEERSDGRIKVTIYSNASLASTDDELAELVNSDTVQIACIALYNMANVNEALLKYGVLDLPFMFESDEEYYKFIDSDYGKAMLDEMLEVTGNVWEYSGYIRSWQALSTTNTPAYTPADIKGKTIICGSPQVFRDTVSSWGANVGTVPWSETYTAMEQGSIDGNLRAVNLSITQRFFEVQKYMTLVNTSAMVNGTLVSRSWYENLPEDLQKVFIECMDEYIQIMRDYGVTRQEETIKQLEENGVEVIQLTDEQKAAWVEPTSVVYDKMEDIIGADVIAKAREILGK